MDSGLAVLKPLERTWKDDDSVGILCRFQF
jgi:hypothetical protein